MYLLLIEDDLALRTALQRSLVRASMRVDVCGDGALALEAWRTLQPSTIVGLRLAENGELGFLSPDGDLRSVTVQPDSAVFSWLIVLRVREFGQGRLHSLVLLRDSMSVEQFRLLRVWLRWLANPQAHVADGV